MTGEEADWIELKFDLGMPSKLVAWRQKLSDKAKQEETFRFYSLYSLVCHPETLTWAWILVRRGGRRHELQTDRTGRGRC